METQQSIDRTRMDWDPVRQEQQTAVSWNLYQISERHEEVISLFGKRSDAKIAISSKQVIFTEQESK